jgi:hypothetical protein
MGIRRNCPTRCSAMTPPHTLRRRLFTWTCPKPSPEFTLRRENDNPVLTTPRPVTGASTCSAHRMCLWASFCRVIFFQIFGHFPESDFQGDRASKLSHIVLSSKNNLRREISANSGFFPETVMAFCETVLFRVPEMGNPGLGRGRIG